jgi:hypothetical protein
MGYEALLLDQLQQKFKKIYVYIFLNLQLDCCVILDTFT